MRLAILVLLFSVLFCACAARNRHPPPPTQPVQPVDRVQLRACESCRHDLELCKRSPDVTQSSSPSACMDQFMSCIALQQLDTARCAGMN